TDNNRGDFSLQSNPKPQNVTAARTPGGDQPIKVDILLPDRVEPGQDFYLHLQLQNQSDGELLNLRVVVPLPEQLDVSPLQKDFNVEAGKAIWLIDRIDPQETLEASLALTAPWTYLTLDFTNIHVEISTLEDFSFAETRRVDIQGGTIPIAVARDLVGSEVIVEGVATMFTGGYFAGSGNVKFYLEDETHGVQVWVPSGEGSLDITIGARVRVRGLMDVYRGAHELVTATPEDVEVIELGEPPDALEVPIQQAVHDEGTLPGRLVSMQGTATRVEEFNYSYEIDLVDETGNLITLYIDKLTEIPGEFFEAGRQYEATGILESTDDRIQLYPRIVEDLREVFPATVRIEVEAPITVIRNQPFEIIFKVHNNTFNPATGLELWLDIPAELRLIQAEDKAERTDNSIRWSLPEIPPNGGSLERVASFVTSTSLESIRLEDFGLRSPSGAQINPEAPVQIFLGESVPIWAIQWEGDSSPLKLKNLKTRGVVTGIFPELGGFWIQNTEPDDNPDTSEGLFIAIENLNLEIEPGCYVEIEGQVREISSQTQLQLVNPESIQILNTNQMLPLAVSLDPPRNTEAAREYYEHFEGMLAEVDEPAVVVGPSSRYGEFVLVLAKHDTTRLYHGEETGWLIHVDDGSEIAHNDRSTLPYALSTGDRVFEVRGPLAYTYGNYKIEPLSPPQFEAQPVTLPSLDLPDESSFSVMTWNVENLFDILDPHPADPPRPRKAEYELQLTKIANTILSAETPVIIAFQEVEHIGILEDLAVHPLLSEFRYMPYLLEGSDSRGIDVGYMVRSDLVEVLDVRQYPAPEGLTSRPPLMLHLNIELPGTTREVYVVNNHLTSLAGGEAATEPRRTAQAAWNVSILKQIQTASPQADIIVLGDLNSFFNSAPLDTLRQAGLQHVYDWLPEPHEYTYIFEGVAQNLDHILVTPALFDTISDVSVLHANADYALPSPGDESPQRKSDHDPVIVTFSP
ncbi:MAG: endonuclease/exonuclease/phosphatase family protein, partial [Anaerolineales bacterium]